MDNYRSMFGSRISAGAAEKLPETSHGENWCRKRNLHGRTEWKVTQWNVLEDIVNLRIKRLHNLQSENAMPGWPSNLKKKKMDPLENYSQFAHKMFQSVQRIGRLDFFGMWINFLVRSRLWQAYSASMISFIHQTCEFRQHVGNTAHQCKFALFQDSDYAEDWMKTRSQHGEVFCAFSEVEHLCQIVGCARNRLLCHTAQQKLREFLLPRYDGWTEFPSFIYWTWWLKYFIPYHTKWTNPKHKSHREIGLGAPHSTQARQSGPQLCWTLQV